MKEKNRFIIIAMIGVLVVRWIVVNKLEWGEDKNEQINSNEIFRREQYAKQFVSLDADMIWEQAYEENKSEEEDENESVHAYESFRDFPYDRMEFVNEDVYASLRKIYESIVFGGEFEQGDLQDLEFYVDLYQKLVKGEVTYLNTETNEEIYLCEDSDQMFSNLKECVYYFFDMDGNYEPELCIAGNGGTYIFKYDISTDKIVLWLWENSNVSLNGSRKMSWTWEGVRHGFYQVDESGRDVLTVFFSEDVFYSNGEPAFMVTFPKYFQESGNVEPPEEMKKQAYYDVSADLYYFWVTERQYRELTSDYFEAKRQAEVNREKVQYSYEELFGEL